MSDGINQEDIDKEEGLLSGDVADYEASVDENEEIPINQMPIEERRTEFPLDQEQAEGINAVLQAAKDSTDPELKMLGRIGELRLEAKMEEARVERSLLLPDDESMARDYADRRLAVAERLRKQTAEKSGKAFAAGSAEDITARVNRVLSKEEDAKEVRPVTPAESDEELASQGALYTEGSESRERIRRRLAERLAERETRGDQREQPVATQPTVEPPPPVVDGRINKRNVPPLLRGIKREPRGESEQG